MFKIKIKQIRKLRGVSQTDLAIRLRCSRSWVSKIENKDIEEIPLGTIKDIFKALGLHPSEVCDFCNNCKYKELFKNIKKYNLPK